MAWGWKFGNETGKMILTLFRLAAVIFGTWYLVKSSKQQYKQGIYCLRCPDLCGGIRKSDRQYVLWNDLR